jgi:cation diffusion facilitator family transporter
VKGYARKVRRVLVAVMLANLVVAIAKVVIGSFANSLAVVGDGLHSGVDALANGVALLVLRYSTRPADEDHPYGHSKYETMAAFFISAMLLLTAFELGRQAVGRLVNPEPTGVNALTMGVMGLSLIVNVVVAWSERRAGTRYASDVLLADAAQTRADIGVSLAVLVGLGLHVLAIPGLDPILDPLLALGVALFIAYAAYSVFRDVLPILTDRIAFDPVEIAAIVRAVPGVRNVHDIRSRGPARESYVQMHLVVDRQDVAGAHAIADEVERRLAEKLGVKETFVHVEPDDDASGPPGTRGERVDHGDAALGKG